MGTILYINFTSALSRVVTTYSGMSPPFRMWKTCHWEAQLNGSLALASGWTPLMHSMTQTPFLGRLISRHHTPWIPFSIRNPCNPHAPLSDLPFPQKFRKYALNKQTNPLTKIDASRAALPKFSFKLVFNKIPAKMLIWNSSQLFYWNQFKGKHFPNAYKATKIINNVWLSHPGGFRVPVLKEQKDKVQGGRLDKSYCVESDSHSEIKDRSLFWGTFRSTPQLLRNQDIGDSCVN